MEQLACLLTLDTFFPICFRIGAKENFSPCHLISFSSSASVKVKMNFLSEGRNWMYPFLVYNFGYLVWMEISSLKGFFSLEMVCYTYFF